MSTDEQQPARGRPRRTETDDRIVRATQELIREKGPAAVNVAAVSSRSGVARTTIYRRYQDRAELLGAALQPLTDHGSPPEGRDVGEKVAWLLARTEDVLAQGIGLGGVASVLTDTDADFSAALRRSLHSGLQPVLEQIRSDVASGALSQATDPDLLLNLVVGSYLAESLRRRTPDLGWRTRTAEQLAQLLAGRAADE